MKIALAIILMAATLNPGFLHADGTCKADIQKFCSDVQEGQGRIIACLKAHGPDLSPDCQADLQAARNKIKARINTFKAACDEDEKKFCGDVQPGEGRIKDCMDQHASELSGACQAVMPPAKTTTPS